MAWCRRARLRRRSPIPRGRRPRQSSSARANSRAWIPWVSRRSTARRCRAEPFWREIGDPDARSAHRGGVAHEHRRGRGRGARDERAGRATGVGVRPRPDDHRRRQRNAPARIDRAGSGGLTSQLPQRDLYDVGFDASWELDVFGRVNRTVNAYGTLAASAEHGLRDVQVSLAAEVARTYFELRGAEQQLAVARRNAENQRRTCRSRRIVSRRGGERRSTPSGQSRSLQLTLAAIPVIESRIAADRNRIATLLGRAPGTLPADWLQPARFPRCRTRCGLARRQQLVRRRPDVLGAERQLAAPVAVRGRGAGGLPAAPVLARECRVSRRRLRLAEPARARRGSGGTGVDVAAARPRPREGTRGRAHANEDEAKCAL